MATERFSFAALAKLDGGRVATAVEQAIKRAVEDCGDRPGEDKPRKVTLEIEVVPVMEGAAHDVHLKFMVGEKAPARRSAAYVMRPTSGGGLLFNDMSLDDPDQGTIPFTPPAAAAGGAKK